MSDVLSAAARAQATQPVAHNQLPALPDELMPRRFSDQSSLTEPKLEEPPDQERQPLLRPEIVESIAWRIAQKNLAETLDVTYREQLASTAKREYKLDDDTRAEWKTHYRDWLNFALQVAQKKTYPWPNASNVIFPLLTVAALSFNARAYPAIVMGRNVVKGTVEGDDRGVAELDPQTQQPVMVPAGPPGPPAGPGQPPSPPPMQPQWIVPPGSKQKRADNIGRHMSWQLLTEMPEWEEQTDRLLILIAIAGCMFRKSYYDPARRRNVSETVNALRVCVNYKARSFDDAARISEEIDFFPWEIETNIRSGLWLDYGDGARDYGRNTEGPNVTADDDQAPVTFIEQHRRFDIDDDGYDEPVIITFARDSGKLARITVGFDEDSVEATADGDIQSITPIRFYTKYGFVPNPDDSPYDIGFGQLLYPLNDSINTSINQMFDAGHLANAGGGFIGGGASLNTGSIRFMTGEYKMIPTTSGRALRENIVPLEFPGPSQVLFQLLEFLVASAKEIASINDVLSGEIPGANVPGILGLAVIQQGLKVFNAVFKRVHRSLRSEFEKLFRLNRLYLPDQAGFRMGSQYFQISRQDYELGGGVEPVSDPDMVTDTQQMAQANFLAQFIGDPTFDQREIRLRMLQAACVQQIDKLLAPQSPPNAELLAKMAELDLGQQQVATEKRLVELRAAELRIRAAHQEAELAIRMGKDKAIEIRELSQAILNLANARKADAEVDQDWYGLQLENLRHQIELLNTTGDPNTNTPASVAGPIGAALAAGAGNNGGAAGGGGAVPRGGLPSLAAPPGNSVAAAVS